MGISNREEYVRIETKNIIMGDLSESEGQDDEMEGTKMECARGAAIH